MLLRLVFELVDHSGETDCSGEWFCITFCRLLELPLHTGQRLHITRGCTRNFGKEIIVGNGEREYEWIALMLLLRGLFGALADRCWDGRGRHYHGHIGRRLNVGNSLVHCFLCLFQRRRYVFIICRIQFIFLIIIILALNANSAATFSSLRSLLCRQLLWGRCTLRL